MNETTSLSPRERIETQLKTAMKAREKEAVSTLRILLTEIKNQAIRTGEPVDETAFIGLVRKGIKQRRESADIFRKGDRIEMAEAEERELSFLEQFLPKAVAEEELRAAIQEIVDAKGLSGPKGIGQVMPVILGRYAGRADGAVVSRLAREILGAG